MTTKQKKPRHIASEVLEREIKENEKMWFISGLSRGEIKKQLRAKYGLSIRRIETGDIRSGEKKFADEFSEALRDMGQYYWRRKKPDSLQDTLTDDGWNSLRYAVMKLWPELIGLTLNQGYELIRTKIRTNRKQIAGLPTRMHYWKIDSNGLDGSVSMGRKENHEYKQD